MALRHQGESPQKAMPGDTLLVIHDFEARSPDELSLRKGDKIELIERDDDFGDGWYLGKHLTDLKSGLFPEVYTTLAPRAAPVVQNIAIGSYKHSVPSAPGSLAPSAPSTISADTQTRDYAANDSSRLQAIPSTNVYATQSAGSRVVSAPPPASMTATTTATQAPRATSMSAHDLNDNSTVMNETLGVIDEHLTHMASPGSGPHSPEDAKDGNDSGSEYSAKRRRNRPVSYIHGDETDEDEQNAYSEAEVMRWNPTQVAKVLDEIGVEPAHTAVFLQEEFSGEVLLGLDQATIFLKELDLGAIGRRLRTWHKIRAFQDDVLPPRSTSALDSSIDGRSRGSLSRKLSKTSVSLMKSPRIDEDISEGGFDQGTSSIGATPVEMTSAGLGNLDGTRANQGALESHLVPPVLSVDGNKETANAKSGAPSGSTSKRASGIFSFAGLGLSTGSGNDSPGATNNSEPEEKKTRGMLRKRGESAASAGHARHSSLAVDDNDENKRHSRFASASSFREMFTNSNRNSQGNQIKVDTSSSKVLSPNPNGQATPMVTKLDYPTDAMKTLPRHVISTPPLATSNFGSSVASEGDSETMAFSDNGSPMSPSVKTMTTNLTSSTGAPTRTTSLTGKSVDSQGGSAGSPATASKPAATFNAVKEKRRSKGKKETSAYLQGLRKSTPQEAMQDCDYSGWMKKKSPGMLAVWKPRLFVLKGRRLAYYYSENDTEEKGLIDISSHRVLPADNEFLTGLHATVTGAKSSPTSPANSTTMTMNEKEAAAQAVALKKMGLSSESMFIFKLVPPRSGLSRAVQFTKPAIHYFACDNIKQGRLWMAALMKTTIDRDETAPVKSTYNQPTISLAKARAMRQRPPNLMNTDDNITLRDDDDDEESSATRLRQPQSAPLASTYGPITAVTVLDKAGNSSITHSDPSKLPAPHSSKPTFGDTAPQLQLTNPPSTKSAFGSFKKHTQPEGETYGLSYSDNLVEREPPSTINPALINTEKPMNVIRPGSTVSQVSLDNNPGDPTFELSRPESQNGKSNRSLSANSGTRALLRGFGSSIPPPSSGYEHAATSPGSGPYGYRG